MKTTLCFGDSNTWGYAPGTAERYDRDARWPGVLRASLGDGHEVIEEGHCGRTTVWDDPVEGGFKNGRRYLIPCLESHAPLDLVVLMLGTNDLKQRFAVPAADIARSAGILVDIIQTSTAGPNGAAPGILLLIPPPIGRLSELRDMFAGALEKSRQFSEQYRLIAAELDCPYLDTATVIRSSDTDGIHLEAPEHRALGLAVADRVREMLA